MNRQAKLKRRRQMAASGAMPASLAGEFTLGEDAVLCIVADECRVRGSSDLSLDEIADKASVGRSAAKSALRKARELGLITVQNRGRLTNVVRSSRRSAGLAAAGRRGRRRLVDMWLTATFGFKDRYSDQEIEAVCKELDEAEQQGAIPPSAGSGMSRQPSLNRADDILPLLHLVNRGSVGSRREGLTLAADRRQPFGWPMTRNNARIIAKYLREAGWSEVTALRQEVAASKARVQEMGRYNATEAEHFRAICRRIDDWVSIMTTGHAALSEKTNSADGVVPSRAELIKPSVNCADGMLPPLPTSRPASAAGNSRTSRRDVKQPRDPGG